MHIQNIEQSYCYSYVDGSIKNFQMFCYNVFFAYTLKQAVVELCHAQHSLNQLPTGWKLANHQLGNFLGCTVKNLENENSY